MKRFDLKEELKSRIKKSGGFTNSHAHIDRAYTVNKDNFKLINAPLEQKWNLNDEYKKSVTVVNLYDRMARAIEIMLDQNVTALGTFIDVDPQIKDKSIMAAEKIRKKYSRQIEIKFINQCHKGVLEREASKWFAYGADFVDIIGGLPRADIGREKEHVQTLLHTGKKLNKMVHVHVDQLNSAKEKETELLAKLTIKNNMQGRVVAIHGISIAAHKKTYRKKLYSLMREAKLMAIACPTAWIDSRRSEEISPIHNALTPVDEMIDEKLTVALGTDNIADIYKPFSDGDMWIELRLLLEGCRISDLDKLVKIASKNGRKVLGL